MNPQDNNLSNFSGMPQNIPPTPAGMTPTKGRSMGPLVGIIIIILVIVLGGLYFWGERLITERKDSVEMIENTPDPELVNLRNQNSSDETASIEADLESTNLDSLDSELSNIEAELK